MVHRATARGAPASQLDYVQLEGGGWLDVAWLNLGNATCHSELAWFVSSRPGAQDPGSGGGWREPPVAPLLLSVALTVLATSG